MSNNIVFLYFLIFICYDNRTIAKRGNTMSNNINNIIEEPREAVISDMIDVELSAEMPKECKETKNDLLNARKFFVDNFSQHYITAMQKIFRSNVAIDELNLTGEEIKVLLSTHPELREYGLKHEERVAEEQYYQLFLNHVDNASRYYTKLAENSRYEYHVYKIVGIENVKDVLIREHGEYVYSRAVGEVPLVFVDKDSVETKRDFARAEKRLCCLVGETSPMTPVIDLDLYRKYLGYKGIKTSVDYDTNTFYFGEEPQKKDTPKELNYKSTVQ